jgi:hypothetical protein
MSITTSLTSDAADLPAPIDRCVSLPKAAPASSYVEIGAVSFERVGAQKVVATFQTSDGERLQYLMTIGTVIALVNAAACINNNGVTLRELGAQ